MVAPLQAGPPARDPFADRPFLVFWEITRACALACQHCRAEAQPRRHPAELDEQAALHLVDQLAELAPPMLILTGGDPLKGRQGMRSPLGIRDGRGVMFISHTGVVSPSGFLPFDCGNVRERHPAAIYREHPLFVSLRDSDALGGKCGRCEFRKICGGSRARAYGVSGDPFAEDPSCSYQPASKAAPDPRPDANDSIHTTPAS